MKWKKLSVIFKASNQTPWMYSHTAMPMAMHMEGDVFRIYFGSRTEYNRPSVSYIDIDINKPDSPLRISEKPVLTAGKPGCFDDNGLYPGSILKVQDKVRMYYMGRSNGQDGMYYMSIGVADSYDGGDTFERFSEAPIMGRSHYDPWMVTTPWVAQSQGQWRMWYTSGLGWNKDLSVSYYHIKQTESLDGLKWEDSDSVAIELLDNETNIAAPTILREDELYHMWFSYVPSKSHSYRLGYATSEDGCSWERQTIQSGLELSDDGWDSLCMAYPCVFKHNDKLYMLYSGNELGKAGIGLAVRYE